MCTSAGYSSACSYITRVSRYVIPPFLLFTSEFNADYTSLPQAMRYPLNAHRKELAAAEGAREREKELAKEIQEGDLDDDDGMGDF